MPEEEKKTAQAEVDDRRPKSSPLIFISHDTRDAELAELFCRLLSSVSAGVLKTFRSSDRKGSQGIEYGVDWYPELMSKLESASDVVCLLTHRSVDRPWLLYEAGVAKGKLNTPVLGVALGIPLSRANSGPFAQFHNCEDNEEALAKLVMQLVRRIPGADPDREAILMQVRTFKERATQILASLDSPEDQEEAAGAVDDTSVAQLFEEIKVMFQDLPSRMESRLTESPVRRRNMRRLHPKMLDEMVHTVSREEDDPLGILMLASFLRDDFPWLYELGVDIYHKVKSGDIAAAKNALHSFRRAVEFTDRWGWMDDMGLFSKDMHMIMMELPFVIEHYFMRALNPKSEKSNSEKEE